jgi:hypothetical protein
MKQLGNEPAHGFVDEPANGRENGPADGPLAEPADRTVDGPWDAPAGHSAELISAVGLCAGVGSGRLLKLDEPLSLWGGTDLHTGIITDVHHPQHGTAIAGRVLLMSASRGSSSSSSVLAEQIRAGVGPAALVLCARDAILALGSLVAAELYGIRMPIVLIDEAVARLLPDNSLVTVSAAAGAATASISIKGGPS